MAHEERPPAPGALALVQRFVNSLDYPAGPDEFADPEAAARWARGEGIAVGRELTGRDCARLRRAREALRDLLETHGEDDSAPCCQDFTAALGTAPLEVRPVAGGWRIQPAGRGADAVLGAVAVALAEASITGTWHRLKVCAADTCRFAFYDHSKNGRGTWCTMQICGARAKARAYRERRRAVP
jgi:predicted RNA-binding Zn ribbon-like protein